MRFLPRIFTSHCRSSYRSTGQPLQLELLEDRTVPSSGWAIHAGGPGLNNGRDDSEAGLDMVVDESGDIYVSGTFFGTVDFDPGPGTANLTSAGEQDIFVARYSAAGALQWAMRMGSAATEWEGGRGIALDGNGNVYVTGEFAGTADFGPHSLTATGLQDIFVAKLNGSNGSVTWARGMGGSSYDRGTGIVTNSTGIYVTGAFTDQVDFDPDPGNAAIVNGAGGFDIFVLKIDANGGFSWVKTIGGSGQDRGRDIARDSTGSLLLTGSFSGTVDFDPGPATFQLTAGSVGGDGYVAKLDSSGNFVWAEGAGGPDSGSSTLWGVAVDGSDNVLVSARFAGTVSFGPASLTSAGSNDIFIARLDSDGNHQWLKGIGGAEDDFPTGGIAVDATGAVYVAGSFQDVVDFDPGASSYFLSSLYGYDVFHAKLDANGNFVAARAMQGREYYDHPYGGIALDGSGHIFTTGAFEGSAQFDTGTGLVMRTSLGEKDFFLVKTTQEKGAIAGRVFADLNGNGIRESEETFLEGITVYLDANNNGTLDDGEVSALTDANGAYLFRHRPAGNHTVRQDLPPGWSQTSGPAAYAIPLAAGQHVGGLDFGNFFPNQIFHYDSTDTPRNAHRRNLVTSTITVAESSAVFALTVNLTTTGGTPVLVLRSPSGQSIFVSPGTTTTKFFNGENPKGDWKLELWATSSTPSGQPYTVNAWSLDITALKLPQVESLTASPNPVAPGNDITLTANNVHDLYPGGSITGVAFYRDANGDGMLQTSADVFVGNGTISGSNWTLSTSTSGLANGSHTFFAQAVDNFGIRSNTEATTVTVGSSGGKGKGKKKLTATSIGNNADAPTLTQEQVIPLVNEAIRRLSAEGHPVSALGPVHIQIRDLNGAILGAAVGRTLVLDINAAGHGWFIDATPWEDSEFLLEGDQGEQNRIDLLTVIAHELGHLLGLEHEGNGIMTATLSTGERHLSQGDRSGEAMSGFQWRPSPTDALDLLFAMLASKVWGLRSERY